MAVFQIRHLNLPFLYTGGCLDTVLHDNGRTLVFTYSDGLLTRVDVDPPAGNLYALFGYDGAGRLSAVTRITFGESRTTSYCYENICNALTQRVNAAGQNFAYGVAYYTNSLGQFSACGNAMALNGLYYSHTLDYTRSARTSATTRVAYQRGDADTTLDYSFDPWMMHVNQITGPGFTGTPAWSNTFSRFTYDNGENITSSMLQDGASGEAFTQFATFDACHNVLKTGVAYGANAVQGWQQYAWNADGTLAAAIDPINRRTTFDYTNGAVQAIHVCPDIQGGLDTRFWYTPSGLLAVVTNANGHSLAMAYNTSGYLINLKPAVGPDVGFLRDAVGRITAVIQPGENGPRTNAFTLDGLGHVLSATRPDGRGLNCQYDILGNPTNVVDFAGRTNLFTWLPSGNLQSATRWVNATPVTLSNTYDRQFNTLKITDPLGRIVESYQLDGQDRPISVTNIEGQTMAVNYGVGARILSIRRFDGTTVNNTFDAAGRVATVQYPGATNNFTWNIDGTLCAAGNAAGAISNTFSSIGRLAATMGAAPNSTVSYGYFPAGQVSNVTSAAGAVAYTLDAADRVSGISCNGSAVPSMQFLFNYNPSNGMPRSLDYSGGANVINQYDILDRITSRVWRSAGGVVTQSFAFGYSSAGMITNIVRQDGSQRVYTYDSLDRLIDETRYASDGSLIFAHTYGYDLAGNRTNCDSLGYTYANNNDLQTDRLTSFGPNTTNLFDAAGNITNIVFADGRTLSLTWNRQYQLTVACTNGVAAETYAYDALGRRAWTCTAGVTNWHVYDGPQVIADLDATGGVLRAYTWGPGIDNLLAMTVQSGPGAPRTVYALKDHQNTVWALTDTNGVVVESYDYDAWGRVLAVTDGSGNPLVSSAIGNRYLFQGREYSWATGLYYFRARWYDPVIGRWLSNDPIGISGGLDQYVFCANNPVNAIDPAGDSAVLVAGAWIVGTAAVSFTAAEIVNYFRFKPILDDPENTIYAVTSAKLVTFYGKKYDRLSDVGKYVVRYHESFHKLWNGGRGEECATKKSIAEIDRLLKDGAWNGSPLDDAQIRELNKLRLINEVELDESSR